jgi:hypothetical protein
MNSDRAEGASLGGLANNKRGRTMENADKILDSHMATQEDQDSAGNVLKHESAERIFNLLLFLFANRDCTRKEIFEHLASCQNRNEFLVASMPVYLCT